MLEKRNCDFCGTSSFGWGETRDGKVICGGCMERLHFCEVCGSLPINGDVSNQLHYEEECFK